MRRNIITASKYEGQISIFALLKIVPADEVSDTTKA